MSEAKFDPAPLKRALQARYGHSRERLVLIGAGASVEAGLPAGPGLHKVLLSQVPFYSEVTQVLQETSDVERVFRAIDLVAAMDQEGSASSDLLKAAGRYDVRANDPGQRARDALVAIVAILRWKLWLSFPALLKPVLEPGAQSQVAYLAPLVRAQFGSTIVSLNYDNCIEHAVLGAVNSRGAAKHVTVPKVEDGKARLLKIHGSLDWQRVGDDVLSGMNPRSDFDFQPAIVFGAGNKLRYFGPFLGLFGSFLESLQEARVVVTIGYGFRDEHVNDALRVWAYSEPVASMESAVQKKLLVVGMGPGGTSLPPPVVPWQTIEHLDVEPVTGPASAVIAKLFE